MLGPGSLSNYLESRGAHLCYLISLSLSVERASAPTLMDQVHILSIIRRRPKSLVNFDGGPKRPG